ncbi:kelch-like protein 17 [Caerostris extrusa]|uniref:Kelch-like protein 17 n=1 Tax=Caerostris extrusa TaxID=172846 RepID=A0AAV4PIH0_CAEEX|nr:kelch-like protein 17 [Caerostris extrusa]
MAEKYNLPALQKNASAFIHNHIVEVFDQSEILEFPVNKLEAFFKEKQCLIPQHVLLSFICKWVDHDSQYGPGGSNVDNDSFMTIAISAAIHGLQKYPSTNNTEENTPITVAPLEKDPIKEKAPAPPLEESVKLSSDNDDTSNSSFDNTAPDCGADIDYDDDTQSSEEEEEGSLSTPVNNRRKIQPRKLKAKSVPQKITMTTRRSAQIQKTVPPIKITRKSSGSISAKPAVKNNSKVSKQNSKPLKTQATPKQPLVVSNRSKKGVTKPMKKRYVSETDSDDDDDDDDDDEEEGKFQQLILVLKNQLMDTLTSQNGRMGSSVQIVHILHIVVFD